jgi:hypothetical protein
MMPPEIEEEFEALQTWYSMLEEAQTTAAIYHLIQLTTLIQVHFLAEALKLREMELVVRQEALENLSRAILRSQMLREIMLTF